MAFVFIYLLLIAAALLYYYYQYMYSYWERQGVPHEKPIPPFGNVWGMGKTIDFHDLAIHYYSKFKGKAPFAGLFFIMKRAVMILDLDLVKNILIKDFSNFRDRNIFNNTRDDPLTGHLFILQGEQWRAMRQKLSPIFTSGKMRYMHPTIVTVSERLVSATQTMLKESPTNTVDIKDICSKFTMDVIGSCAFGLDCKSLTSSEQSEFCRMAVKFLREPRHSGLVQAFIFSNPDLARRLRMKFIRDDVTNFFINVVKDTVNYRMSKKEPRNDLMDLLIELKAKTEDDSAKSTEGIDLTHGLTMEQLAAQAFVFFIAGFDTSSTTMALCLYELAIQTDVQDKLRREINKSLAKHNNELTYDCINELEYLEMVISETLRKYPLVGDLIRKTIKDYKVPNSNYTIKAGTLVFIPVAGIHADPDIYPEPEKFIPERFTQEAINARHPSAFLGFGDGPRHCIGMRFGKAQAKIGVANLLRHYRFTTTPKTEIPPILNKEPIILALKNGLHLRAERI